MSYNKFLTILLAITALVSCRFEDTDCIYRGYLTAYVKDKDARQTSAGAMVYYPYSDVVDQTVYGNVDVFDKDTIQRYVHRGSYDLLYYEKGVNKVEIPENGSYRDVRVISPTYTKNGITFHEKEQSFIASGFAQKVLVNHDLETICSFRVQPLTQEIALNLNIISPEQEVKSMKAILSGLSTEKSVYERKAESGYASLQFDISKTNNLLFERSLYVLGINHGVSNILYLYTILEDGRERITEVDLSELLQDFDEGKISINLDVDLSRLLEIPEVTIKDWDMTEYAPILLTPIK